MLILCFSFATKTVIILNWANNQTFIAKQLCEKRNVKNNCCQGKCYLKKQLKKVDQDSESTKHESKFQEIDCFILFSTEGFTQLKPEPSCLTNTSFYENQYSFLFFSKKDRPPGLV